MKKISELDKADALRIINKADVVSHDGHFVHFNGYHSSSYIKKNLLYTLPVVVESLCKMFAIAFRGEKIEVVASSTLGGISLSQLTALSFYRYNSKYVQAVFAEEEDIYETVLLNGLDDLHDTDYCIDMLGRDVVERNGDDSSINFTGFQDFVMTEFGETCNMTMSLMRKIGTRFVFGRGYDEIIQGRRVLIIKDTINTGATIIKLKEEIESCGGEIAGVCTICNWSGGKVTAETLGVPHLLSLLDLDIKLHREDECPICRERGIESVNQELGDGKNFLARKGVQI